VICDNKNLVVKCIYCSNSCVKVTDFYVYPVAHYFLFSSLYFKKNRLAV